MDHENLLVWQEFQRTLRIQLKPYGNTGSEANLGKDFELNKRRLLEIIKRTSSMSESNSVLIIGPRGSGKSMLIDQVIEVLFCTESLKTNVIPVILNGLIHTDDNIALKDIVRQLKLENVEERAIGSFAEKLVFLLEALKAGSKQNKSILFVLDEFDLFCSHKDQTLLYNLFDVAQSQQSPICVIGLSCQPDILSKLENRVRSRFSHQLLYLFETMKYLDYSQIAQNLLCLPSTFSDPIFRDEWNSNIYSVLDSPTVQDILRKYYDFSCNVRDLKRYLFHIIVRVSLKNPKLVPGDFINAFTFCTKNAKAAMVQGLSILEISLIIAMMHLTELYDGDPFNFEMVYHEYKKFLQKKMCLQSLDKAVVMKAFEHLLAIEMVKEVSNVNKNVLKQYVPIRLLLESNEIKEALNRYSNLPYQLQQWVTSSILD